MRVSDEERREREGLYSCSASESSSLCPLGVPAALARLLPALCPLGF